MLPNIVFFLIALSSSVHAIAAGKSPPGIQARVEYAAESKHTDRAQRRHPVSGDDQVQQHVEARDVSVTITITTTVSASVAPISLPVTSFLGKNTTFNPYATNSSTFSFTTLSSSLSGAISVSLPLLNTSAPLTTSLSTTNGLRNGTFSSITTPFVSTSTPLTTSLSTTEGPRNGTFSTTTPFVPTSAPLTTSSTTTNGLRNGTFSTTTPLANLTSSSITLSLNLTFSTLSRTSTLSLPNTTFSSSPSATVEPTLTGLTTASTGLGDRNGSYTTQSLSTIPSGPGPVSLPGTIFYSNTSSTTSSSTPSEGGFMTYPSSTTTSSSSIGAGATDTGGRSGTAFPTGISAVSSLQNSTIPTVGPGNGGGQGSSSTSSTGEGNRSGPYFSTSTKGPARGGKGGNGVASVTGGMGPGKSVGPVFTSAGKVCSVITTVVQVY